MRTVLITGSGKRLGAIIARHLAANGHKPVIHYNRSSTEADALAKELGTVAVGADLSDLDAVRSLIRRAREAAGQPLCGLVNCASIFEQDRPETVTGDALEKHYRINTVAPLLLARAFAEQASADQDPVIVNIIDQKVENLHPDFFSYTLTKIALDQATLMMAQSFAPKIRVVGVSPGYTLPAPAETEEAFQSKAASANILQKRLNPDHIAQTVQFCFDCPAITGLTIMADNGEHLLPTDGDIVFRRDPS